MVTPTTDQDAENIRVMNHLQDHGVISDLCVDIRDIARADLPRALAFLESNPVDQ
jgi:hypothetical protein